MIKLLSTISYKTILLILAGSAVFSSLLSLLVNGLHSDRDWWSSLFQNFSTEMGGAFLTFWLLQVIFSKREIKEQIILDMRSRINNVACHAVEQARASGLMGNGFLQGADLRGANLQGADLAGADLKGADLQGVDLRDAKLLRCTLQSACLRDARLRNASLVGANLQGAEMTNATLQSADFDSADLQYADLRRAELGEAVLQNANLRGANLENAFLQRANLWRTNLEGARLVGANLHRTNLSGANLQGAILCDDLTDTAALFDETTILPNGVYWTPDTDMSLFADAAHPNFWQGKRSTGTYHVDELFEHRT